MKTLAPVLPIIRSHHERWDGGGYPDGLAGEKLPLLARMRLASRRHLRCPDHGALEGDHRVMVGARTCLRTPIGRAAAPLMGAPHGMRDTR
jgi:hypothetical protein